MKTFWNSYENNCLQKNKLLIEYEWNNELLREICFSFRFSNWFVGGWLLRLEENLELALRKCAARVGNRRCKRNLATSATPVADKRKVPINNRASCIVFRQEPTNCREPGDVALKNETSSNYTARQQPAKVYFKFIGWIFMTRARSNAIFRPQI